MRSVIAALVVVVVVIAANLFTAGTSQAQSLTLSELTATVNGTTVSVSTTVRSSTWVNLVRYGVCVRDGANRNLDFTPYANVWAGPDGLRYTASKTLSPGWYTYFTCVYTNAWAIVGSPQYFTVQAPGASSQAPPPSGAAMPRGDLPGWRQVLADDFTTPVGLGGFPGPQYRNRWFTYGGSDTSRRGYYDPSRVLSVSNGVLDWYIRTENGVRLGAPVVAINPQTGWGQTYGRYAVRFRSDIMDRYKIAFLLWPDSDNWGEGEIDFPETTSLGAGAKLYANMYSVGNRATWAPGPAYRVETWADAGGSGWHVATIDWVPGRVTWYLDGHIVGSTTSGVPSTPMHWVLQVETATEGSAPLPSTSGHVQVDWATMYTYAP